MVLRIGSFLNREGLVSASKTLRRPNCSIMTATTIMGVSRRTIYNWIAAGKVQYFRTAGGTIRIFEDSLIRDEHNQPVPVELVPRAENFIQ